MKFLLRLRHWQLFLLTWGLPIAVFVLSFFNTGLPVVVVMPIMMVLFTLGFFGWVWAISTQLNKKLPAGVKLDVAQFKIFFLIPIVFNLGISIWMGSFLPLSA